MKILIVDDSAVMRNMIKRALASGGVQAEILEAGDGQLALAQVPNDPDLILCDWNMPNMDGLTFVRELRKLGSTTPVLMVTTETHFSKQTEAKNAGANGFVAKPFTPDQLASQIKEVVPA
ncbi:MAG: response regulator [Planctomycetota bacterium]